MTRKCLQAVLSPSCLRTTVISQCFSLHLCFVIFYCFDCMSFSFSHLFVCLPSPFQSLLVFSCVCCIISKSFQRFQRFNLLEIKVVVTWIITLLTAIVLDWNIHRWSCMWDRWGLWGVSLTKWSQLCFLRLAKINDSRTPGFCDISQLATAKAGCTLSYMPHLLVADSFSEVMRRFTSISNCY